MTRRILLLSAYDAISHRQWRTTLASQFPEFHWTQLSLPARYFSWRVRGNSLSWGLAGLPELRQNYDLLIATSVVDLASLRGFCPALARIPTLIYFHENQFAYPHNPQDTDSPLNSREPESRSGNFPGTHLDAAMVSLYTALCGDRLAFNSEFNRRTFLTGIQQLLVKLPDQVPPHLMEHLQTAEVLPVPLQLSSAVDSPATRTDSRILDVAWNHRWEYDKGPALLQALIEAIAGRDLPIRFHLMGQQFRRRPAEFTAITEQLQQLARRRGELAPWTGYIADRRDYHCRLARCDVVLSTAAHDFQGLAVLEGCALGCTPLCPDDLVYPEYLEDQFLYPAPRHAGSAVSVNGIIQRLMSWQQLKKAGAPLPHYVPREFMPAALKERYLALFNKIWEAPG